MAKKKKSSKPKMVGKRTKFSIKSYWAPTPKKIRKVGDAMLGVFSITSMSSIIMEDRRLAIISLVTGVLGKVVTNFFSEEPVYVQEGESETQMD